MQARRIVRARRTAGGQSSAWNPDSRAFEPIDSGPSRQSRLQATRASLAAERAAGLQAAAARAAPGESEDDSGHYGGAADYEPDEPAVATASGLPSFSNRRRHPLLWRSEDGNEVHFLVSRAPAARCSKWSYSFVALRILQFTDGQLLTGWCSDSGCDSCRQACAIAEGCTSLPHPKSWYSVSMCERCQQMVRGVGGQARLASLLAQPRPQSSEEEGMFRRHLDLAVRKRVTAVKSGEGLEIWGILESGRCNSCRSNPCQHTAVRRPQQQQLSEAEWERRFLAEWCLETGQRNLSCISRKKLAERIESCPTLLRIYTRAQLNYLYVCSVQLSSCCTSCRTCSYLT